MAQPATSAPQIKCTDESVREKCVNSLFLIGDNQFPNSTKQLDGFCGKLKDLDKCIKDYTNKCMTPTGRRATQVAIAGVARMMKRMCKSTDKKKGLSFWLSIFDWVFKSIFNFLEFIKHSKCGNAALPDMKTCLSGYKMALYGAKQVEVKQKLPILCWSVI